MYVPDFSKGSSYHIADPFMNEKTTLKQSAKDTKPDVTLGLSNGNHFRQLFAKNICFGIC